MSSFNICMNKVHSVDPSSEVPPIQHMQHNNNNKWIDALAILCAIIFYCLLGVALVVFFHFLVWAVQDVINLFFPNEDFKDPTFNINSLTLSNLNVSSNPNQISANWNITTSLGNINKHYYFKYSEMTYAIYYYDIQVGVTGFQPTYINPGSHVLVQFAKEFTCSSGYVNDTIISTMRKDIDAGTVKFNVLFQSTFEETYRKGKTNDPSDPYPWIVVCENVELIFGLDKSQSQMLNGSYRCKSKSY